MVSTSPSHEPLARLAAPTSMGTTELVLHQLLPKQPIIYYIIKGLVFWRWLTTMEIVAFFFWAKGIHLLNTCCALGATRAHFVLITAQVFVFLFYRWGNWGSEMLNNISGISQALARIGFEPMSVSLSLIASLGLSDTYKAVSWEERESLSSPVVALPSLSGFTNMHCSTASSSAHWISAFPWGAPDVGEGCWSISSHDGIGCHSCLEG